jgi:hypothetical protein
MYPFFSGAKFYYTYVCIYIYIIHTYIYIHIHEYNWIHMLYTWHLSESTNLPAAVFCSSLCQLLDELEHGQYQLPNESAQISAQCDHVRPVMPTELGNDTTCGGVSLKKNAGPKLHTDFDWRHPYAIVARICTGTAAFSGGLRQKVPGSSPLWTRWHMVFFCKKMVRFRGFQLVRFAEDPLNPIDHDLVVKLGGPLGWYLMHQKRGTLDLPKKTVFFFICHFYQNLRKQTDRSLQIGF